MKISRFFFSFWRSLSWAFVIIYLSAAPKSSIPSVPFLPIPHLDKLVHFGMYFCLVAIILFDSNRAKLLLSIWQKVLIILSCLFLGVLLEAIQYLFSEGRSAELFDIIANSLGVLLGFYFFQKMFDFIQNKKNKR